MNGYIFWRSVALGYGLLIIFLIGALVLGVLLT
jgi:hypothetical protein